MAKKTPEVNASSMADIAFLLLIFYLVTTTMNVDSGILRLLPPMVDEKVDNAPQVKERNILIVKINFNDQVSLQGQLVDITQIKDIVKHFITNPNKSEDLPETEEVELPHLGKYPVSKGIVSLQNDKSTTYEKYVLVQNELSRAFNEAQNELAISRFGKPMADLDESIQAAIRKAIPSSRISEAEPRDLSSKKK